MPHPTGPPRPSPAQLRAAVGRTIRDLIAPDLRVLFCGINPGRYSGATGCHFAGPGNRFWRALHDSGFTPRVLDWREAPELLTAGCGITNLVARTTATAAELSADDLRLGRGRLRRKVRQYSPRMVAVVGIGAYRIGFGQPRADFGLQPERLGKARLWVLPNTSGLNANHQAEDFARLFGELHEAVGRT